MIKGGYQYAPQRIYNSAKEECEGICIILPWPSSTHVLMVDISWTVTPNVNF